MALGAVAAREVHADRVLATLGAFFLAVGIGAHALDELDGRPLGTRLSDRALWVLAAAGVAGAVAIGVAGVMIVSATLVPFILAGAFLVVAYNLELFGGRLHSDFWFAAAWGAFPAFTSFWANSLSFSAAGVLVAGACFGLSVAQRALSTPVRELRRRTASVHGEQRLRDGGVVELSAARLAAPLDSALRAIALALVLLAAGLLAVRV